jgi:hypothetical protein
MLQATQLVGFAPLHLPVPVVTYRGTAQTETDLQNFTGGSLSIGAASPFRYMIVGCYGSSFGVSSVVASATPYTFERLISIDSHRVQFWIAPCPEGTTSTVTMNGAGTQARQGYAIWTVESLNYPQLIDSATSLTATGATLDVETVEGGFVLGYGFGNTSPSFTWSGITEEFETLIGTNVDHSGGSASNVAQARDRAVSVSVSGAGTSRQIVMSMR